MGPPHHGKCFQHSIPDEGTLGDYLICYPETEASLALSQIK